MNIFKLIRATTKPLILIAERLFNTAPIEREPDVQKNIDTETKTMALYEYNGCPFCMITRRAIRRLNLNIELRDSLHNPEHKAALINGGGKTQVPCLRIKNGQNTTWMYESKDIITYLEQRFGETPDTHSSD